MRIRRWCASGVDAHPGVMRIRGWCASPHCNFPIVHWLAISMAGFKVKGRSELIIDRNSIGLYLSNPFGLQKKLDAHRNHNDNNIRSPIGWQYLSMAGMNVKGRSELGAAAAFVRARWDTAGVTDLSVNLEITGTQTHIIKHTFSITG